MEGMLASQDAGIALGIFDVKPPGFSAAAACDFARQLFGVEGETIAMTAERDQVFHVAPEVGNGFVLHISNEDESFEVLDFQNAALRFIAARDPELPVPRVCPSLAGHDIEIVQGGSARHAVRLFTYLCGEPIMRHSQSAKLRLSLGRALARLDTALVNFAHPTNGNAFLWDVPRALKLRPLLPFIAQPDLSHLVRAVFDEFETDTLPTLPGLRAQVIHNDFNPKNVLVAAADPTRITGVIDFGDMIRSPLVTDLAVAVARQITPERPDDEAVEIISAYHSVQPLKAAEVDALYGLISMRLAMRIVIWAWRLSANDPRCDPSQIALAHMLLASLRRVGAKAITCRFHAACMNQSALTATKY